LVPSFSPASWITFRSRHNRPFATWGYYANAAGGKRRKAAQTGDAAQAPRRDNDEFIRGVRLSWRQPGTHVTAAGTKRLKVALTVHRSCVRSGSDGCGRS
jgi:hypothetical protein